MIFCFGKYITVLTNVFVDSFNKHVINGINFLNILFLDILADIETSGHRAFVAFLCSIMIIEPALALSRGGANFRVNNL